MTKSDVIIFENILEHFQRKKVVQRIYKSSNPVETFKRIQKSLEWSFEKLRQEVSSPIKNREILPNEALEVCTIWLMSGMGAFELLDDYQQLILSLQKIEGEKEKIAKNFFEFLFKSGSFTDECLEDMIKRFYSTQTP